MGWALDWWSSQAEQEDILAFAHEVMVPLDLLRLASISPCYTKYLTPTVLAHIDFLTLVTKQGVDGAQLLRTIFAHFAQERGQKIDSARVEELAGVAQFVREALVEFHSVHDIVDEEITEAEDALKRGDYEVASTLFQAAVKKYPNLVDAYFGWAEAAASLGKNDVAKKCLKYIQSRSAKTPSFSLRLGNLLFRLGEHAEAKRHYQQSIILDSNNPASYFNMAIIVSREGKYDEGLRHARAALNCQPEDASLCETVAFLEYKCGLQNEAVSRLNSLLVQYPQRPETQALLQQVQSSR
jgi:tetratricopeptide (TPR) repeat protein